jgi:hypothetical protein
MNDDEFEALYIDIDDGIACCSVMYRYIRESGYICAR